MQVLTYYSVVIPNKPGEANKVLDALKNAGVNLIALWAYPIKGKNSVMDIAAADPKACAKALKSIGLAAGAKKQAFHFDGEDRPGAVAETVGKLAAAGINCHAAQGICAGSGRYGLLVQVADEDFKKAKKVLA